MTPQEFISNWKQVELSERSACQSHFLDLCELLNQPKPARADPAGTWYTFERGVDKSDGGKGWADVWMQGKFGWEYKGKHKDLKAAYRQLSNYREALENPPLLVVCDLNKFEIHTNFTGTIKQVHAFDLDGLDDPKNLQTLRNVFTNPDALKPGKTPEGITQEIAERFATLSDGIQSRGVPPLEAAHFLMKLMFCMFAEKIELLPKDLFTKTITNAHNEPARLSSLLKALFEAMETGGNFGPEIIDWFNGGLFADHRVIDLTTPEIKELVSVAHADWSNVEPTIFGTLFERTLDPDKRSQIGAHFTSSVDIETLVKPVMMEPLRREWAEVKAKAEALYAKIKGGAGKGTGRKRSDSKERKDFDKCLQDFAERLAHVEVLDPACGSGNFLYVAINLLLELEKEVLTYAADHGLPLFPGVRPTQLHGLEINTYAAELAQVVIWIGFLQWMHFNGYVAPRDPVLQNVNSIVQKDSIIDLSDPENPKEPVWPDAEFIVGNPPFLGGSRILEELGRDYQQGVWKVYDARVPGGADLCCYWFEKARHQIETKKASRAGLLATQAIRGGTNREVLTRIKNTGDIFFAVSDLDWVLDGALVHVSMVGFDRNLEETKTLDGKTVAHIHANLTAGANTTTAARLRGNAKISFIGPKKAGSFNIPFTLAESWLHLPNPNGKPNSDVLVPWINGTSLVSRLPEQWIIDSGEMSLDEFCLYEAPYGHALKVVKPDRDSNKERRTRENWWRFKRSAPELRILSAKLPRFLATVRHAKHRIFAWLDTSIVCDDGIFVFTNPTDWFFGLMHSRIHETWARAQGTQVRERESGFRYTPTTCFETFPFPEPTNAQRDVVATIAKELDTLRNNSLNPPEWTKTETLEFPGSADGPWKRYVHEPDARGIGTVRYPRLVAKDDASAAKLKKRTLTNLYNEMPTWLKKAHAKLDEIVFAAYGWPVTLSDDELLAKLLALNLERSQGQAEPPPAAEPEADEDSD